MLRRPGTRETKPSNASRTVSKKPGSTAERLCAPAGDGSEGRVQRVDERTVPSALPPGDHVVHHVPEAQLRVGIAEPQRPARAEVTERTRVGPERSPFAGGDEPQAHGDGVTQHRARSAGL